MLTIRSRWYRWLFGSCHAARNFTHALLVSADLGADNGFTPDECGAMQCALGFACSTAENVMEAYRGRSRRRKKIRCREVIRLSDMQNGREDDGGKRSVSLSEARDLLQLVYIERVNFGTSEREKRKKR